MKEHERLKVASHPDHESCTAKAVYRKSKQIFPKMKLLGLSSYNVSVIDLYIPRIYYSTAGK
jgi:hypothetical protein